MPKFNRASIAADLHGNVWMDSGVTKILADFGEMHLHFLHWPAKHTIE